MTHSDKNVITNSSFQKIVKTKQNKLDTSQKAAYIERTSSKHSWKRIDSKRNFTESNS